jgi:hypothetical protein
MSSHKWDDLDPFTQRQIELQPWDTDYGTNPPTLRTCGCEVFGDAWQLCQYHDGVEDGASELRIYTDEYVDGLRVGVNRLTAANAELERSLAGYITDCLAAEAREKALRAITEDLMWEMLSKTTPMDEWDCGYGAALSDWIRRTEDLT